ncbi:MAG: hypothetical protein KDI28_11665 [Pseudomonadales bacterium]|nr:hypothetical protein [Pseudomonadales bacterium]
MPVSSAPVINGSSALVDVLFKVTKAWSSWQSTVPALNGWHLVGGSEIGLASSQLSNGVFHNSNAEAIVAAATYNGLRTLAIGFRGTNDNEDWKQDFQNINGHYTLFNPLVTALNAAIARGEFDLLLVTGHSLGGAMTQMFMADYQGIAPAYAITTGAPGYLQSAAVADARLINYQVTDDPIVFLGSQRAAVGQTLSSFPGSLMVGQLGSVLSSSFGIPATLFSESVPFFTQNYYPRGTVEVLKVEGHPDSPLSSVLSLVTSYNSTAHDFSTYEAGLAGVNRNPFDLTVGQKGGSGNDTLFGTTGNDTIEGGAGGDILYLHVNHAQASVTRTDSGLAVTSTASGTDTLNQVERIAFTDGKFAYDLGADESAGKAIRLIGAALDAPALAEHPDWVGVGIDLFDQGKSVLEVAQLVIDVLGNPSNESLINSLYTHVAGAAPSEAELQHFVGLMEGSGGNLSKAQLLEMAALYDLNEVNIGLVGLQATGVEFV